MGQHPVWNGKPAQEGIEESSGLDLGGMVLRHKWLIMLVSATGLSLGYLYYVRQPAVYQSSARVMVTKERQSDLPIQGLNVSVGYEDALATQIILLRSPLIIRKAVERHKLAALPSFGGIADPTGQIIGGINITRAEEKATVLDLTFRAANPQDCAAVLDAVLESYQEFLGDTQRSVSSEAIDLISEAKDKLLAQLSQKEADYRTFRQKAPLLWKGNEGTNIHHSRLSQVESSRSAVLISRTQTKAQLQAVEAALKRGANREALMLMVDKAAGAQSSQSPERQSLASQLFPLLLEEVILLENHGPDHPKVKSLQKRISLTKGHLQKAPDANAPQEAVKPVDFVSVYLESLRQELNASEEMEAELNALFVQEQEAAKAMAVYEVQEETYQNEIARTQQLFDSVVKRLEELTLVKNYGGYKTQLISPAGYGLQVEPNFSRIISMAGVLGAFAGFGLAYLLELADKSFRNPDEIRRELGMPVIGHIPVILRNKESGSAEHSGIDGGLCTVHRPRMRTAEAYRSIRTALYFSTRGDGHKVIQITSPEPGDGKSTLTANLAVVIAQSGKSVLLIDADFRRPRIHKLFGLEGIAGMSSVINGEVELADAVQSTSIKNLSILACGPRPDNPSELLTLPRFKELLDVFREKYDFVLIDTPPLMAVSDPSIVAARVDGVILTIRIKKKGRHNAQRATEALESIGANVLGVVVNGVGGRGGYGYGYGARYGYASGSERYRYDGTQYGYNYDGYGYSYGYEEEEQGRPPQQRIAKQ
jgi:capsular exopolysaccharide synthesis family protein